MTYRGQLGNRARRAEARRANLELARQRAILDKLQQDIEDELTRSFQDVIAAYDTVRINQSLRQAASTQLQARQALYENGGQISVDLLLRTQSTYADAVSDQWRAVARYNQSLAVWIRAVGAPLIDNHPPAATSAPTDALDEHAYPLGPQRESHGGARLSRLPPVRSPIRANR